MLRNVDASCRNLATLFGMCVKQRFHFHVLFFFFSLIRASKFQQKRAALAPASTLLRKYDTENLCFGPHCSGFGNYLFRTVTVIRTQGWTERNEHRQNDRTHTERMMTISIALKYPPNRRIFLYSVSAVEGTVDLISCCSHEEASVLQWTLLYTCNIIKI